MTKHKACDKAQETTAAAQTTRTKTTTPIDDYRTRSHFALFLPFLPSNPPPLPPTLAFQIRTPLAIEKWSPLELSLFETSMSLYGKQFNLVSKSVKTKTVREVIELYYLWKKSDHYKSWKRGFECLIDAEEDVGGLEGSNSGEVI